MLITPREGLWEVTCGITRGMTSSNQRLISALEVQ